MYRRIYRRMYRYIVCSLSILYLVSSLPVNANSSPNSNSEPQHLFPINPLDRFSRKDEFDKYSGYNNRDYLLGSFQYYMSILELETPKGYTYCSCRPEFGIQFVPAFERNGNPSQIGFRHDWEAFENNKGECIKKNFSAYDKVRPDIDRIVKKVNERNSNPFTNNPYEALSLNNPNVFNGGVSFTLPYHILIERGCHIPKQDCPKLVIRAIPIVRTTITCKPKK